MSAPSSPARLFIGSSAEGLPVAYNLQAVLEQRDICEPDVWTQNVFAASGYALDSLLQHAASMDFAVLVASPDDVKVSRGEESPSARDNVLLEFGLFAGALGRERTFILPTGNLRLPSDTLGLTLLTFRPRENPNLLASVNEAALEIERQVQRLGPRERAPGAGGGSRRTALESEIALLCLNAEAQGWTVKKNNATTLRLRTPRGRVHTLTKRTPDVTRADLRRFVRELRAAGLRVNNSVRVSVEESPQ